MSYAGFWSRFFAFVIDVVILSVPSWLYPNLDPNLDFLFTMGIGTAYVVWMNGTYGATIGKMVVRIKIVRENGKKMSYSDALVRELASILSFVVLCLGYFNVIWDKKKQAWHDKIAHTIVIKA